MSYFIAIGLITIGMVAIFSAIIGLFRFSAFYTKIHAVSVIDSFGAPLCFIGLSFLQSNFSSSFKLVLAALLLLLLNPVATHALGKASLLSPGENEQ